ncbi:MAG: anaerobic ribonucleoside-triphosphate reductase activating protein [candidate division WOR-3 bacterium]|nr:anaerobic ribonucleoside-triphosphate reductase activating protein [candidate division WOR-3 bacterium]
MKILGFIETSLVDWERKVCSVIFVGGCNLKCPFCQNYSLVKESKDLKVWSWQEIKDKLISKKNWLDGVVISGGEPTIHPEIFGLLIKIKQLGFPTKIDTNGTFPYVLKELIELGLIDYIAMDVKTALDERYYRACGRSIELCLIKRTVKLLKESNIDYEFRTTLVPKLVTAEELIAIAREIAPAKSYVLQQFVPQNARQVKFRNIKPYSKSDALEFQRMLKLYLNNVSIRGF